MSYDIFDAFELDLAIIYHRPNFAWEVASFKYKVSVIWPPSLKELFTQKWKLTHSETQKKIFWGTKQLLVPIDFHSRERNTIEVNGGPSTVWLIFFKISSFMFNIRKKLKQVWNDMRVTKWWQILHFGWTIPLIWWIWPVSTLVLTVSTVLNN